ncbi:MAG TPA: ferredoxin [Kofleriaceae bacterium]|nr:ferredoxin [Kofleriaceae bacterium]
MANPRRCCGAGRCAGLAPELFEQSLSDGTVIVRVAQPPAELASLAREAVALCPTRALAIVELV